MYGPCEKCRSEEASWYWNESGPYRWLCGDCLDAEAYEAREPITEHDIDQIDYEIAEFEASEGKHT